MSKPKNKVRFSLDRDLRVLARKLIDREGMPARHPKAAPFGVGKDLVEPAEHGFLLMLAAEHMNRHSPVEPTPGGPVPCPQKGASCLSLGLSRAILTGCDMIRDRSQIEHVERLRQALWNVGTALEAFDDELRHYLTVCKQRHETSWKMIPPAAQKRGSKTKVHDHTNVCVLPLQLRNRVKKIVGSMDVVEFYSLLPQYASKAGAASNEPGRKRRPLLIAEMQADLFLEGWSLEEIGRLVDDGQGGTAQQVKERIRKRLSPWIKSTGN